jgi:cytochrome b561
MSAPANRYDSNTISLHWLTALIVVFQFLSAEFWGYLPRPERHFLIVSHMSLGFLLTAILSLRIVWRLSFGTRISEIAPALLDRGAAALHILLYLLLAAQMPLGFFTRWTDNQPLDVFGLAIASPLGICSKPTARLIDQIHDINAWVIMALAGLHAVAGLVHHYLLRDSVLQRMLPALKARR